METFFGQYVGKNFVLSNESEALRIQLVSILNTPSGSRFYYPSYGSRLNEYNFNVLNYYTVNMIGQEVKNAISLLDGVSLVSIDYVVDGNKVMFMITLQKTSNRIRVNLTVQDGVAS